jgi:hypothetical protein
MLSSAMAGLGGCLLAAEIGSVTADRFSLFESMTMLMLLVVAGAGYVSGGLSAGLLYGAVFLAMQAVLTKLGTDYSAFHGPLMWLAEFTTVLPALIGIGLGRNPSGFLNDVFASWGPMIRRVTPVFVATVAIELGIWLLAFRHTIDNWTFTIATVVLAAAAPRIAALARPEAFAARSAVATPATSADRDDTPLELVGVTRPFTAADRRAMDRVLGLDEAGS